MKSRILSNLQGLAAADHPMKDDLMTELGLTEAQLVTRCKQLITDILHNYSFFSISTIDTFFQRVVRSFAKEIGIQAGFRVELDQRKVISDVVDQLIQDMNQDPQLLQWLTQFAVHQINEGKPWDTKRDISTLSFELFKELVIVHQDDIFRRLDDPTFMPRLLRDVQQEIRSYEDELKRMGQEAFAIMKRFGLSVEDFTQKGRGVGMFIQKMAEGQLPTINSYVKAALEEDKWASEKSAAYPQVVEALANGLDFAVGEMVKYSEDRSRHYLSMKQVVNHLYTFGLLGYISRGIEKYRQDNELLLISDFPQLLAEIIHDSDSPYIYEKIGTRFRHYLIDEFQDTSGMQWRNFRPLVADSLSAGNFNMLVGDIKQSIYRWRGGDWNILLNQVGKDIDKAYISSKTLDTNRRSKRRIIDFNNTVFKSAPGILAHELKTASEDMDALVQLEEAYDDAVQNPFDSSDEGHVRIDFIDSKEEEDKDSAVLERLITNLQELQDQKYALSEITILVRTNSEGRKVVKALLDHQETNTDGKYRYDVVSNESLFVKNNAAVHVILQCLQLAVDREEILWVEQLKYALSFHYETTQNVEEKVEEFKRFLEGNRPGLTSLVSKAIWVFDLYRKDSDLIYLTAFQDAVADYLGFNEDLVLPFLLWWSEHDDRAIQVSEDIDAIRLMTVHKSKGLEFKAVLVPWCSWSLDHKGPNGQLLWSSTSDHEPISMTPWLPVRYKGELARTYFANEYLQEKHDAYLDSLNLLYVALTRAEEVLYLTCPVASFGNPRIATVADLLRKLAHMHFEDNGYDAEQEVLTIGAFQDRKIEVTGQRESFNLTSVLNIDYTNQIGQVRLGTGILDEERRKSIDLGDVVHWILSQTKTKDDFQSAIDRAVLKFAISTDELSEIKLMLRKNWELPQFSSWFDPKWQVRNEYSILLDSGKIRRPDRVISDDENAIVIDFKTGLPDDRHKKQVGEYKGILQAMGYEQVDGYIAYLSNYKIVNV